MNLAVLPRPAGAGWHDPILAAGALGFRATAPHQGGGRPTYLHGAWLHRFQHVALVSLASILEREWGATRFLLFYFLCGIGAALIQLAVNWHEAGTLHAQLVAAGMSPATIRDLMATGSGAVPVDPAIRATLVELYRIHAAPMVGASGAIYGLMVAFGCLHPNAKLALVFVPVPVAAKYFIPALLALDLLSGVTGFSLFGAGIAHFAHLGGAAIGFLLMLLWRQRAAAAGREQAI